MIPINVKKLHPNAKIPSYANETDAGLDLFALEDTIVPALSRIGVKTGISIALPAGFVSLVWDKSSVSFKHGLTCLGGVIDAGYRGEYIVILYNTTNNPYTFKAGEKVAQVLIQKVEHAAITLVDTLDNSQRGTGGFGSSGK
jgi:dUTP pyrophosphatase